MERLEKVTNGERCSGMKTLRVEDMVSFAPSQVVLMSIKVYFFSFNVFSSTYLFLRVFLLLP